MVRVSGGRFAASKTDALALLFRKYLIKMRMLTYRDDCHRHVYFECDLAVDEERESCAQERQGDGPKGDVGVETTLQTLSVLSPWRGMHVFAHLCLYASVSVGSWHSFATKT